MLIIIGLLLVAILLCLPGGAELLGGIITLASMLAVGGGIMFLMAAVLL